MIFFYNYFVCYDVVVKQLNMCWIFPLSALPVKWQQFILKGPDGHLFCSHVSIFVHIYCCTVVGCSGCSQSDKVTKVTKKCLKFKVREPKI